MLHGIKSDGQEEWTTKIPVDSESDHFQTRKNTKEQPRVEGSHSGWFPGKLYQHQHFKPTNFKFTKRITE